MKNTTKENLLAYIRGPFRSSHSLSSSATTWLSSELGLQQVNAKVRFWLGTTGPSEKAKAALAALRETSDETIAAELAVESQNAAARVEADEKRRAADHTAWEAKWAAMTTQAREDYMREAQWVSDEVERAEQEGRTKTGMDTFL